MISRRSFFGGLLAAAAATAAPQLLIGKVALAAPAPMVFNQAQWLINPNDFGYLFRIMAQCGTHAAYGCVVASDWVYSNLDTRAAIEEECKQYVRIYMRRKHNLHV